MGAAGGESDLATVLPSKRPWQTPWPAEWRNADMPQEEIINGINATKLRGVVEDIKGKPDIARFTFRAKNKWVDGTHSRTTIGKFYGAGREHTPPAREFSLEADEPEVLLGNDHGPNATEALLHALGTCLNATFMYHAAYQGVKVDELEIDLEGDLDLQGLLRISRDVRNGFDNIRVTFRVKSDAPREKIEELCQLAQQHSPVFDMLTNPTPVTARLELKGDTGMGLGQKEPF
jgi:uncharacterized OsmC-like protein